MAQTVKRKVADGSTRYDVRTRIGGRVVTRTFDRRKDADAYAVSAAHNRMTGYTVDPAGGRLTFEDVSERWLGSNPGKRDNTIGRDRSALRAHIVPAIGTRQLRSISPVDVQRLVNAWAGELAPKTVHRTYGTLRAALTYAVNADLIARSPCRNIKLPQVTQREAQQLAPEDVGALAAAVDERYRAMVWIGALLGLRWGEVAGLRVGRIDLLGRKLNVAEIVTRDAHGRSVSGPPKSAAGIRSLSVPDVLVDVLAAHLAALGLTGSDSDCYVFGAPGGGPLSYSNFRRRIWQPATVATGMEGVGFHDLRRMAATALVLENVDLKTAQTRLGHSDPRLTLAVYAQATTEADRAAADSVGRRFAHVLQAAQ